jgi:perosamine synthetase
MRDPHEDPRRPAEEAAVLAAMDADDLTEALLVEAFEEDLAIWTGGISCVAVATAGGALHVAYAAAGLGPGDDMVVSPLAAPATVSAAAVLGARVVFADVDDETATLDPSAVAASVTSRTRVVTTTDDVGHPSEYDDLREVTEALGAVLVADTGAALGATYRGVPVGALADLTALSLAGVDAPGGAVAVADEALLDAARRFRGDGADLHTFGLDYRPPAIVCALGRSRLRTMSRRRARRTELADRYSKLLDDVHGLRLPVRRNWVDPTWSRYAVRVPAQLRPAVVDQLQNAGIRVHCGHSPAYWQPVFVDLGYRRAACPIAERVYAEQIGLPLTPELTDDDQDRIVDVLRGALTGGSPGWA